MSSDHLVRLLGEAHAELERNKRNVPEPAGEGFGRVPGSSLAAAEAAARAAGRSGETWAKGREGEERFARLVEGLLDYQVLHSVPNGTFGGDIDHVLVGRRGVFTVDTKNYRFPLTIVDGRVVNPFAELADYRQELHTGAAIYAACGWRAPVTGSIVAMGTGGVRVLGDPDLAELEHRIRTPEQALALLREAPVVLSDEQVDQLRSALSRPETWRQHFSWPELIDAHYYSHRAKTQLAGERDGRPAGT